MLTACKECVVPARTAERLRALGTDAWVERTHSARGAAFEVGELEVALLCDADKRTLVVDVKGEPGGCVVAYNAGGGRDQPGLVEERHLELCGAEHGELRIATSRDADGKLSGQAHLGGSLLAW